MMITIAREITTFFLLILHETLSTEHYRKQVLNRTLSQGICAFSLVNGKSPDFLLRTAIIKKSLSQSYKTDVKMFINSKCK